MSVKKKYDSDGGNGKKYDSDSSIKKYDSDNSKKNDSDSGSNKYNLEKSRKSESATKSTNIFDLTALVGFQNEQELKKAGNVITAEEQNKLLQNYEEVDKNSWNTLPTASHIRYLRKDGTFRIGGFIKNSWVGLYGNSKGKNCLQLASSENYKSTKWTICLDDIEKIWKKKLNVSGLGNVEKNIISPELYNTIQASKESIEYLTRTVEQLKIEISKINNDQIRMMNLIKKLPIVKSLTSMSK